MTFWGYFKESTGFPDVASAELQHPAIRLMCVVNVVVTALEFIDATVLYVDSSIARSLQWRSGLKTQWL